MHYAGCLLIRYEKAKYLKEDLNKFLSAHTEYPYTEMTSMIPKILKETEDLYYNYLKG